MKTLQRWLLVLLVVCTVAPTLSFAQAPIVLSSADAPLVFELPLDASTTQSLTATTTVQLATRAQHSAQGMVYPDWLSDATFSLNSRPMQRLAIVVTPKRGNPELSTELLMTLNNAGRRSLKPLHLMFDTVSRFEGAPTVQAASAEPSANPADNKPDLNVFAAPVIRFEGAPASAQRPSSAVATPVPDRANANANTPRPKVQANQANKTKPLVQVPAPPPAQPPAPASPSSAAVAAPTAPTAQPAPPTPAPPALPPRSARPALAAQPSQDSWLSDWPLLLGGFVLLLALLYLLRRALASWRARRAEQVQTNFLEPKPTALAPEELGTNTVFGISDEEANAMHAKWLREQATKRNG